MPDVLVIDDSTSNSQLLKIALEAHGHKVICAFDGQEGLNLANQIQPDVIIVDLRLPGSNYDGWTVIRLLKNDQMLKHIPIIVTAVEVSPEDRRRAFEAGCDTYFSKPFSITALRAQIAEYTSPH